MDWAQVLVIILAVFLAIFLALAIVLTLMLIKISKQIKSVTSSAQRTAEHIESAVAGLGKFTTPAFFLRMITKHFGKAKRK